MSKKQYVSKDEELFFDYLPEEVYNSLSETEHKHYREYRRYHNLLYKSKKKIESYQKEIKELQSLIQKERLKMKRSVSIVDGDEVENEGWEFLMKFHYDSVSHLDKMFRIKVNLELRPRSSRSYKINEGEVKRKMLEKVRKTHKGKSLKKTDYFYGRVDSVVGKYEVRIYFGPVHKVRKKLKPVFGDEVMSEHINGIRWKLKQLMVQYSRYTVFHSNWDKFKEDKHNLDSILEWLKFCEENNIDRMKWGDVFE